MPIHHVYVYPIGPACSASATCSPRRAKSAASIDGASFTVSASISLSLLSHRNDFLASFEDVNKIPISASNFCDRIISCYLACTPVNEWTPQSRPANGETIETRNCRSGRKPFADFPVVLAAAEDDATDSVSASPAGSSHDPLAVFMTLEPFDLPHIRLHPL